MKKLLMAAIGLMMVVGANAQYLNDSDKVFEQDKWYVGASLSGLDLGWHKGSEWSADILAKAGYLFIDDWMITGTLGYKNQSHGSSYTKLGAGIRYYFEDYGVYAGVSGNYYHSSGSDDFRPELNVGYAYFLTGKLTIEPELYYERSTKDNYYGFGFRLGLGLYF